MTNTVPAQPATGVPVRARPTGMAAGVAAVEAAEGARGIDLLGSTDEVRLRAMGILARAETAGDLRTALQGIREVTRCLELMGKFRGEIDDSVHVNITAAPIFVEFQQIVLRALDPFPDAQMALIAALRPLMSSAPMIEGRAE